MKKMLLVAILKLKLTFKDRVAFVWMFLAPLVFVLVFVLILGGQGSNNDDVKYPISIVNNDSGSYSTELIDIIKSDSAFKVKESDYDSAKSDIENGNTALAIIIPSDYSDIVEEGSLGKIDILKLSDNESTIAISAIISNYINQQKLSISTGNSAVMVISSLEKVEGLEEQVIRNDVKVSFMDSVKSPSIGYEIKKVVHEAKPGLDGISSSAIGILTMFIMFFVSSTAGSILEEKEQGTWYKLSSTPIRNYSILGGYILGSFILGWIQAGVLILVSRYAFHLNWGNSTLGLIILFSSYLLAIIGLGSALSSFVKTKAQLGTLTAVIIMPTSLIAGCMWPREFMPDVMLKISNFVPQTWVIKGMTELVARGSDISAVYIPSFILLVFACVFYVIGVNYISLQNRQ